jgi:two-component system sensor histidine kinase KdpD
MTRLSAGQITVDKQWLPIEDVIGSALNRMESDLANAPVQVNVPGDLPLAHFDPVLVELVLINLVDNAIKYSPEQVDIVIRAEAIPSGVSIEVLDRGRGIRPGDERRLFDLFYRGADAQPDRRGTGLGLSICRAIIQAHGGTIEVANRPGGGAAVRFTLPSTDAPPAVAFDKPEPRAP